jgi:hypothetical protein
MSVFALFQEMPDGGQCDHGQHQRVRQRGIRRQRALAKPLPGRPTLHPHIGYGGKLTDLDCSCFGCVNCMIQREAGERGG